MTVNRVASQAADLGLTIFPFDHDHGVPARELKSLLGGKGSGLAEMTTALRMPVPPGFTVPLTVSRTYRDHGWPTELDALLASHMADLGARMGRGFGDPSDPLLVAVRSGAPVSMPGMLDTVLNLGLNDETVEGLARVSGDAVFAWDSYRRFAQMFVTTVLGVPGEEIPPCDELESVDALRGHVARIRELARMTTGEDIPDDPIEQLRRAVVAVFESWDSPRARAYRSREGIDERMGTAVNVQAMVFGNRGPRSGTGVVFTRDPSTGDDRAYGDFLPCAQGEDVVAGTAHTLPIAQLGELFPGAFEDLRAALRRLEVHYRDMCDVEFTIEDGKLWLLQTRVGKRGACAAVKIAAALVADDDIRLSEQEAAARVSAEVRARAKQEVLAQHARADRDGDTLAVGLGASPGRVSGRIVLSSDAAADADDDVILVRPHTSPEDVAGMSASVGILTSSGGLVSHAAVVARGWNLPAVVGARDIVIEGAAVRVGERRLAAGEVITIDGTTGEIWIGAHEDGETGHDAEAVLAEHLPELARLQAWGSPADRTREQP